MSTTTPARSVAGGRFPLGLFLLFTVSGATGLILEVVWSRMLSLLLGVTTWGILTVLVVYLGGLGIGAVLLGGRASRSARPLRFYGLLEILIGVYSLCVPFLFVGITSLYAILHRWQESQGTHALASWTRFLCAALAIGAPTIMLGGTFPSLSRALAQGYGRGGRGAALLYAANTAGAVVGCFVAGFVLIARLGVSATNSLAAVLDIAIGLIALRMSRSVRIVEPTSTEAEVAPPARESRRTGLILAVAAFSGFCGLAFEVLWTRGLLVALVDNTTYAFTMMLTAFLFGHAAGSAYFGWRRDEVKPAELAARLASVLTAGGFLALISTPLLILASDVVARWAYGPGVTFWGRRVPVQMGLCLLVIGPTAATLGGSFALSARLLVGSGPDSARQAGRLYGANTIAAILGAITTQLLMIPAFGTQPTMAGLAVLLVVAGAVLRISVAGSRGLGSSLASLVAGAALAAASLQFSLIDLYASKERMRTTNAPAKLLGVIESPGAIVTIHERGPDDRVINLNGTNVAGTNPVLRTIQTLQGQLPLMLHPDPKSVLQIGFGSGGTYATLSTLRPPGMSIEVLELTPEVIKASERWMSDVNFGRLSKSTDRVTINDARSHMTGTSRAYDLILSDSIHPRFRGNASLYSKDYFELCARRLNPGGLFSTWLPLYGMSVEDLRGIFASLRSVFPHVQIWYPNGEPNENTVVVGSKSPIVPDHARFRRFLDGAVSANRLALTTDRVFDFFLMGDEGVGRFVRGGAVSTDDRPRLEFDAPLTLKRQESWLDNFSALIEDRESVLPYARGVDESARNDVAAWERGTKWKLLGQRDELRGDFASAVRNYARCVEENPRDVETARRRSSLSRAIALDAGR